MGYENGKKIYFVIIEYVYTYMYILYKYEYI